MVGARGFEPPTSWSQTRRSTKLSYAPKVRDVYHEALFLASENLIRLKRMKTTLPILAIFASATLVPHAQVATDQTLDSTPASPQPRPTATANAKLPERSHIDEVFKESSLGKEADERRLHIEWRQLQNEVVNQPDLVAAKKSAEMARTDYEKRQRLRDYYELYYSRMRVLAHSAEMRKALDQFKIAHVSQLTQARVRHESDSDLPTPTPTPKKKQKNKRERKFESTSG